MEIANVLPENPFNASFVGRKELANADPAVAQFFESISHLGVGVGATVEGFCVEDDMVDT